MRVYERTDPLARLLAQTERRDGCLIFTGRSTKNGYAIVGEGRNGWHYGHRLTYERFVGPIPEDRPRLHHECGNPLCVEPSHLTPVSARSHAHEHGLGVGPCRACGTEDFYRRPDTGGRMCRECRRRRRRSAC